MKLAHLILAATAALLASPAAAQLTAVPHSGDQSVVVTAERSKAEKAKIDMSDWRVAETPHVLVFSKSDPKELARIAGNLEKLHFLLSILFNRPDEPGETLKLSVFLIGDPADFDHLGLSNVRWQQGPYPKEFPTQVYYDPREDGAVMANPASDQCFMIERDGAIATAADLIGVGTAPDPVAEQTVGAQQAIMNAMTNAVATAVSGATGGGCNGNPNKVLVTAEGRLYSTYAQHYLLTYFPAAYPRWYLEGFGEMFSNMDAGKDGVIEYGRWPEHYRRVMEKFGHYPVQKVLDGTYLDDPHWFPAFSPYSAWGLAHLLFFSEEWKTPLHNYLAAVARGESAKQAEAALGDVKKLQREMGSYYGQKIPFEQLTYPAGQFAPPLVRQLKQSEAAYVRGRLELGARVTVADSSNSTMPAASPDSQKATDKALNARQAWLERLRKNAADYPAELVAQQLLAEAECRSGNGANCVAAADRALADSADDPVALTWKGYGLALEALTQPDSVRASKLDEARSYIIRANHLDTESVVPLLAYYRSYALAGQEAPDAAIDGLAKSLDEVPSSPTTRLMLGSALVERSDGADARRILLPVAAGAFDPPERPKAEQLLSSLGSRPLALLEAGGR